MGYNTIFEGVLNFKTELTKSQEFYLNFILGEDCRSHKEWNAPNLTYIDLKITKNKKGLEWSEVEKTYDLEYKIPLVVRLMKDKFPNFGLKGELLAQGENINDRYILIIDDEECIKKDISNKQITCKGSMLFGTGCGKCSKCLKELEYMREAAEKTNIEESKINNLQYGWVCPLCGTVHSPYTFSCPCTYKVTC
jgi:hypothetical protein